MSGQFGTGAEVSYEHFGTSAEMSWVRSVLGPKCLDTLTSTGLVDLHVGRSMCRRPVHVLPDVADALITFVFVSLSIFLLFV